MNCEVCGTELPFGAMFCGECGRAVGARATEARHPDSGMPAALPLQRGAQSTARDTVILEPLVAIPVHEHPIEDVAAPVVEAAPAASVAPVSAEPTAEPAHVEAAAAAPVGVVVAAEPEAASEPAPELESESESESESEPEPEADLGPDADADAEVEQDLPPELVEEDVAAEAELDEPAAAADEAAAIPEQSNAEEPHVEPARVAEPAVAEPAVAEPAVVAPAVVVPAIAAEHVAAPEPVSSSWLPAADPPVVKQPPVQQPSVQRPDPFPWGDRGSAIFLDSDELEQTLITARRDLGDRFVLQFSTGESVTVFGTGLLGRNPIPQPGEYFDQLVAISDPGKSVSKTHLEFGQEGGAFWVSDRYSGNGSVVREPDAAPRRLVAGRRYRIVRGSRVDIGEQFFVVS